MFTVEEPEATEFKYRTYPTEHSTKLEPRNPLIDFSIRQSLLNGKILGQVPWKLEPPDKSNRVLSEGIFIIKFLCGIFFSAKKLFLLFLCR